MQFVIVIPSLIVFCVAFLKSPTKAFLYAFLPILLLLPEYYQLELAGLPDPTFSEAAILPVAAAYLLKDRTKWIFSVTDLLVFGFAFSIVYTQFLNYDYKEAQNLGFEMLCAVVLPYVLAKGLIE